MIIRKYTSGYVVQEYDTDKKMFVSQEFVQNADIPTNCEDESGNVVEDDGEYLSFDMEQPA